MPDFPPEVLRGILYNLSRHKGVKYFLNKGRDINKKLFDLFSGFAFSEFVFLEPLRILSM